MNSKLTLESNGAFLIENVTDLSYTYFPMCNALDLKGSLTPSMGGDATIDQNGFLLTPSTVMDLENTLAKRNVYFRVNDEFTWSITGQTPKQTLTPDKVNLYGNFLVHRVKRENALFTCEIESFIPVNDNQELHKITMTNTTSKKLTLKSVVGIPLYGRSAENIRDHRHVTSLLNRVRITNNGIINKPTFSFDERGHNLNKRLYGCFVHSSHHASVKNYHPTLETFTGEGQTLLDPKVLKENIETSYKPGDTVEGYEAIGGMEYEPVTLKEGETFTLVVSLGTSQNEKAVMDSAEKLSEKTFDILKKETLDYWESELAPLSFDTKDSALNGWLKWVTLQPMLRRIYGNSFLPYHDYGRGGKGWRDLWQDLLALIIMNPASVRGMLLNNFKGVRIDGSNATIIGDKPGEFLADRNNITRIWMDHGAWPLMTVKLYIDQSGDSDLLFEKVGYFQDQFTHYTKRAIKDFNTQNTHLRTQAGTVYKGTLLEHLLVQNLVASLNVGSHNNLRLEDADWNDGLDMAKENGESVSFTAFYAKNLMDMADLLKTLNKKGIKKITLLKEIETLLKGVSTDDPVAKHGLLDTYFTSVEETVSGETQQFDTLQLSDTLREKGTALLKQVRENEWLEDKEDGWFNGYYDNDSNPLDNIDKKDMTLTGQVFSIMSGAATNEQIEKIIKSADKHLYDSSVGGYRLNTNFNEVKTNMGRLFGFAYGHKENGAMFSHMALMYANALYKRGFAHAGHKVIESIYTHSMDLNASKMYPGIAEYYDPTGRGMYPYLTGSASWMILTMVREVYGVKNDMGLAVFEPKLLKKQFGKNSELAIKTVLNDKQVEVVYKNTSHLDYGDYQIDKVWIDESNVAFTRTPDGIKLEKLISGNKITIVLGSKKALKESRS